MQRQRLDREIAGSQTLEEFVGIGRHDVPKRQITAWNVAFREQSDFERLLAGRENRHGSQFGAKLHVHFADVGQADQTEQAYAPRGQQDSRLLVDLPHDGLLESFALLDEARRKRPKSSRGRSCAATEHDPVTPVQVARHEQARIFVVHLAARPTHAPLAPPSRPPGHPNPPHLAPGGPPHLMQNRIVSTVRPIPFAGHAGDKPGPAQSRSVSRTEVAACITEIYSYFNARSTTAGIFSVFFKYAPKKRSRSKLTPGRKPNITRLCRGGLQ